MLKHMKIAIRFAVGHGIILIFMLVLAVLAFLEINNMAKITKDFYDHPFTVSNTTLDMRLRIVQIDDEIVSLISATSPDAVSMSQKAIDSYLFDFSADSDIVRSEYLGNQDELARVTTYITAWKSIYADILTLKKANRTQEASTLLKTKGLPLIDGIQTGIDSMVDSSKHTALSFQKNAEAKKMEALILLAAISALALVVSLLLGLALTNSIVKPIKLLVGQIKQASQGDLTLEIWKEDRKDEIGVLFSAFSDFLSNFREQAKELIQAIARLSSTTSEISATSAQLSSNSSETAASVSQTAATVEELKQSSKSTMDVANNVTEAAQLTYDNHKQGLASLESLAASIRLIKDQMENIAKNILNLSEQSQNIAEIISAVDDIAEQSNLLAVNAAIEAAKAGEHGRGFSVVAQEVKSLADQSRQSTKQVRKIIGDIQKATGSAVMSMEQGSKAADQGIEKLQDVDNTIKNLAETINESTQLAQQVTAANQQQYTGIDQITLAIENIKVASRQNVDAAHGLQETAQDIKDLGIKLKTLIDRYKV
jgi:methyl-accepting chemotaxis protein